MKRVLVGGLIIKNKKILLVQNIKFGTPRIEPPGGKVKPGESFRQAVVREVKEEVGLQVKPGKYFGIYDTYYPGGQARVRLYFCEIITGKPKVCEPDKINDFGWHLYKDLLKLKRSGQLVPNMCEALEDLKKYLI